MVHTSIKDAEAGGFGNQDLLRTIVRPGFRKNTIPAQPLKKSKGQR